MAFYTFNGECIDQANVLGRFNALYPRIDEAGNYTSLVFSGFDGTAITYSLNTKQITSDILVNRTGTMAVTLCDPSQNYKAFTIPDSQDFANAWAAGFITPMALGLVAWACALLVNFWRD